MFLKPSLVIEHVTDIDLNALQAKGIQALIFDLDNTLMAPKVGTIEAHIEDWLAVVRQRGFACMVLSNNRNAEYVKKAEELLGIPCIAVAAKPNPESYRRALAQLNLSAEQTAMIGDRPLTDIWVGQRVGAYTILVDPLIKHQERKLFKVLRKLERMCCSIPRT